MGIFGPDTRVIGNEVYEKHADVHSMAEAQGWISEFAQAGHKAKAIPNVNKKCVEIWVCIGQDPRQVPSAPQQPPKP